MNAFEYVYESFDHDKTEVDSEGMQVAPWAPKPTPSLEAPSWTQHPGVMGPVS